MSNQEGNEIRSLPNGWFMQESDGVDGEFEVEGVYGTRFKARRHYLLKLQGYAVLYWIGASECQCAAAITEFKKVMRWNQIPHTWNVEYLHPDLLKEKHDAATIQPSDEAVTATSTAAQSALGQEQDKNEAHSSDDDGPIGWLTESEHSEHENENESVDDDEQSKRGPSMSATATPTPAKDNRKKRADFEDGPIGWLTESEDSEDEEQSKCADSKPPKPKRSKSMAVHANADEKSSDGDYSDDDSSTEPCVSSNNTKKVPINPTRHMLGSIPQQASSNDESVQMAEPKPYKLLNGLRVLEVTGITGKKPFFEVTVLYEDGSEEYVPTKLLRHHSKASMDVLVDFYEDHISL